MRLLYVIHEFFPRYVTGTERICLNLARAMQRMGHGARVVTYAPHVDSPTTHKNGLRVYDYTYQGVPVTAFQHDAHPWDVNWTMLGDKTVRLFAEEALRYGRYDLVHIMHPLRTAAFAAAAVRQRVPYVLTLTDYHTICYRIKLFTVKNKVCPGPAGGRRCLEQCPVPKMTLPYVQRRLSGSRDILSRAARVVCLSRHLADTLQREFPRTEMSVIPPGCTLKRAEANQKRYRPASSITYGYMGSLQPAKGVHVLIEAFRKLDAPSARLHLHGAARAEYAAELIAKAHGDKRIRFLGPYSEESEIRAILQSIDVLCVPSLWHETFGIVIEEAFAAKVPVLASRVGAVPERVRDGVNGFTFPPGDVAALTALMKKLVHEPTLLNGLKQGIVSYQTVEEEAAQYERMYHEVIDSRKKHVRRARTRPPLAAVS